MGASYEVATNTRIVMLWGPYMFGMIVGMIMFFCSAVAPLMMNPYGIVPGLLFIYFIYYPLCIYILSSWWNFLYMYEITGMILAIPAVGFMYLAVADYSTFHEKEEEIEKTKSAREDEEAQDEEEGQKHAGEEEEGEDEQEENKTEEEKKEDQEEEDSNDDSFKSAK